MPNSKYNELCTGCGLCKSAKGIEMLPDSKGFLYPDISSKDSIEFCDMICPMGKNGALDSRGIWGKYESVYKGWAVDSIIRRKASSGGIITALSIYLLSNNIVDYVIMTKRSNSDIEKTETVVCDNKDLILSCMGSRYTQSNPLIDIINSIDKEKKYAFVGKPCDVIALRNYVNLYDKKLKNNISFFIAFFCAGTPSSKAHNSLYNSLSCDKRDIVSIDYRGNGWPGDLTLNLKNGEKLLKSYEDTWMNYLGRDIRKSCKFCYDGIGELADIAVGDLWYLDENKKPIFNNQDGVNIVFARTIIGDTLLHKALKDQVVYLECYDEISDLKYCQPNHYAKRVTCIDKCNALGLFRKASPGYNRKVLRKTGKNISAIDHLKAYLATVKRILKKRI
jgi:coenzyme F420 hydrogenase subunit beta